MISPELSFNVLTRDLSHYLENQVKVGLLDSGVGLSLVLGFSAAYTCYYLISVAKKPQLISGGKKFYQFLREQCPIVSETYYPTFWCWESRIQTLLRPFVTAKPGVVYRNELIKAADGGQISLDWFDNDDSLTHPDPAARPTVLLLPGLTGTSRESYILHMVEQSRDLGYRAVVFNNRGVSGETLLTPRTYCAANTEDLETVIEHIHSSYQTAPIMAAGVSMGGHRPVLEKCYDIDHVMKAKTIREFDERFTSIMFGYATNDDYYRDASPVHRLKSVQVPMLCLNAADDVFSPSHAIPVEAVKQNPNLAMLITCHGGHIGFLEGLWPRRSTYMDRVFRQFARAVIEQGGRLKDLS
ncbi:phospholipase ABHD3 isoform X2 [Corythoichthys intestinalis]|uniref:phospholipase ABHD3 isoform X2 n=1 Tax=Corythoichthys intestinalis TaxID=161448 RepID=UPI0025A5AFDE|nr:phospholipase ABHD3 isoform X2 [Corythoichthys intestinalis]